MHTLVQALHTAAHQPERFMQAATEYETPRKVRVAPKEAHIEGPTVLKLLVCRDEGRIENRVVAAQDSGFDWHPQFHRLSLLSDDLGEELAEMKVDHGEETFANLQTVEILIDPENCPIQWDAGRRVVQVTQAFAERVGGYVCDDLRRPLSDKALESFARSVEETMRRRAREAEPARIPQGDGTYKIVRQLSFVTQHFTNRGRYLELNRFDVPALSYFEGKRHGGELAREMLTHIKRHRTERVDIERIIDAAVRLVDGFDFDIASKGNVARGFLAVMDGMIGFAARHCNFDKFIDARAASAAESEAYDKEARAKRAADFVERMRTAKAAKAVSKVGAV